jgi:hypothetical protein
VEENEMKKHLLKRLVLFVLPGMAVLVPSAPGTLQAHEIGMVGDLSAAEHLVLITRGGLLYDKWYGALGKEAPKKTHPAYTKAGKKKGSSTWRCKECHGWDYKGARGAYAKQRHHRHSQHGPCPARHHRRNP